MNIIKSGEPRNLFLLMELMQKTYREPHFCELALELSMNGLCTVVAPYEPVPRDIFLPVGRMGFNNSMFVEKRELPKRFEHLLQRIRNYYPGVNFQELLVGASSTQIIVEHKHNHPVG